MKVSYVLCCCLFLYAANCNAQNIEKDSIPFGEKSNDYNIPIKMENLLSPDRKMFIDRISFNMQKEQLSIPAVQLRINDHIPFFMPYSYSLDSFMEGIIIKGFHGKYSFTDYLNANIDVYLSRSYFNNTMVPDFYLNGSVRTELVLKLHDRIQLVGIGQLSLREGLDPNMPSLMGGANYYGAGIQFKITNKIGIGVGFTNNYYRGEWTKRTYMHPVGY